MICDAFLFQILPILHAASSLDSFNYLTILYSYLTIIKLLGAVSSRREVPASNPS